MFCKCLKGLVEAHWILFVQANICLRRFHVHLLDCPHTSVRRRKRAKRYFHVGTFDPPRSAFHRWPFSAMLSHSGVWKMRAIQNLRSKDDHTPMGSLGPRDKGSRKLEDKSNGAPPATLQGHHLFSTATGPSLSGSFFTGAVGHPDLHIIHYKLAECR